MHKHNTRDELLKQWHPTKNPRPMDEMSDGSGYRAWWICQKGHEWESNVRNRIRGSNCPYCAGQAVNATNCLATTNPELLKEWHPTKNILTPSEVPPKSNRKIWWVCNKGHEWETTVSKRTDGRGCPFCAHRKTGEDNNLAVINPDLADQLHPTKNIIKDTELAPKSNKKVWWICPKNPKHEWKSAVCGRADGRGCPYCVGQATNETNCLATTHPDIAAEGHPTKNDKSPSEVTFGSTFKVWWKCSKNPNHEWEAEIGSRTQGRNCPLCNNHTSTAQQFIHDYIKQFCPDVLMNQCGLLKNPYLEIDIYIPSLKIGIEYCGQHFHYEDVVNGRNNKHRIKYLQAQKAGIRLITIFSNEYINNWPAVEGYLKSILHLPTESIYARKCEFKSVDKLEYDEFLNTYHIQGTAEASYKFGLYNLDKLVAVMGFSNTNKSIYILNRFCVPDGIRVVGGASKLFKHAIKDLKTKNCDEIISFSDNRYSEGNLYRKLGFTETNEIKPDYQYFRTDDEIFHKFRWRLAAIANRLGPLLSIVDDRTGETRLETEYEAMKRHGFHRIWDCGKKRWSIKV